MDKQELLQLLKAARQVVAQRYPYLASMIFAIRFANEPHHNPDLFAAISETGTIYWNDENLADLDPSYYPGIFLHELKHLLHRHYNRGRVIGIDRGMNKLWNIATDMEINDQLRGRSGFKLPEWAWFSNTAGLPFGRTAEYYYDQLKEEKHQKKVNPKAKPGNAGSGSDGVKKPWELEEGHLTEADIEVVRQQTVRAYSEYIAKHPGSSTGDMDRLAEELLNPEVDWRQLLSGLIRDAASQGMGMDDYTYRRPSRRYQQVVYPKMFGHRPRILTLIDTSGSMNGQALARALSEVEGIIKATGDAVEYVAFDTEEKGAGTAFHAREIRLRGGGGTDMARALKEVHEQNGRSGLIVVLLTDGYTPWPDEPLPGITVIAVLIGGAFGITSVKPPEWIEAIYVK